MPILTNTPAIVAKQTAVTLRDLPYPKALAIVTGRVKPQITYLRAVVGPAMSDEVCESLCVLITNAHLQEGVSGADVEAAVKTFTLLDSLAKLKYPSGIPFEFAAHLKIATAARRKAEERTAARLADAEAERTALPPDQVRASVRAIVERCFGQVGRGRSVPPPTETTPYVGREGETQEAEGD